MIWNWTQTVQSVQPALWTAGPLCHATYQCFHIPTQGSLISIEKMMTFSGFQRIKGLCHHCQPEGTSPRELQAWFCTSFFFELASLPEQHPGKWCYHFVVQLFEKTNLFYYLNQTWVIASELFIFRLKAMHLPVEHETIALEPPN